MDRSELLCVTEKNPQTAFLECNDFSLWYKTFCRSALSRCTLV